MHSIHKKPMHFCPSLSFSSCSFAIANSYLCQSPFRTHGVFHFNLYPIQTSLCSKFEHYHAIHIGWILYHLTLLIPCNFYSACGKLVWGEAESHLSAKRAVRQNYFQQHDSSEPIGLCQWIPFGSDWPTLPKVACFAVFLANLCRCLYKIEEH